MKLTADDLYEMKVMNTIIPEPIEMQESDFDKVAKTIKNEIKEDVEKCKNKLRLMHCRTTLSKIP